MLWRILLALLRGCPDNRMIVRMISYSQQGKHCCWLLEIQIKYEKSTSKNKQLSLLAEGIESVEVEQLVNVDCSFLLGNHPQVVCNDVRFLYKYLACVLFSSMS